MAYDMNIQIVSADQYTGTKFYTFGQKRSLGVRGLQKLVNMVAKYLLTPIGSDPLDATYGTQIPNLLGSNVTPLDAQDIVQLAVSDAQAAIQGYQRAMNLPLDERLLSVTVTGFTILTDSPGFAAQILIRNVQGQGLQFLLPTLQVR